MNKIVYLCFVKCKCGKNTKGNKPLCYKCYLTAKSGEAFAQATFARLRLNNVKRHERNAGAKII